MSNTNYPYEQSFSVSNWAKHKIKQFTILIKSNLILIGSCMILGGILSFFYGIIKKTRYQAEITFIVEDSKNMGGGLLSALGGQIGLDISSLGGSSNGVLSGDNVLELLKSKSIMSECLKTQYNEINNYTLADKYAEVYNLRKKWAESNEVGRVIYFGDNEQNTRLRDSLLKCIVNKIQEKEINIFKPDKKLGFFKVSVNTKDELLSKYIAERIIKIATEFYIDTKTGRIRKNVERLQKRTDSLEIILNKRTYSASSGNRLLMNANPAFIDQSVSTEIKERDKLVLGTVYAELMKNLEISKTALIQETPAIQIVDNATLPLENDKKKWYYYFGLGGLIGMAVISLVLSLRK